jgi:hypothetical protein
MATAQERALAHYNRWLELGTGPTKRLRWTDRGISFTATNPYLTPSGNGIGVTIAAQDSRGPLPVDNPYQFFNPPLGIVTQDEIGEWQWLGNPRVLTYVVLTPRSVDLSDVINAAKAIVYDAVVSRAIQLGWIPA